MDNIGYGLTFSIDLKFILADPSHKLLLAKTEIIPHLLEYSKTSKIHHVRCVSGLVLISIGYFNTSENDSTSNEIDELLIKSLTEMTKVFFLLFNFDISDMFINLFL
jgi:hypothetical protein